LLGLLPEHEGDRVEDRFAADEAYLALYQDVERGLVRDYAAGNLPQSDAERFERYYLVTSERKRQLIVIRALQSIRHELKPECARRKSPRMRYFFAFACAVLIVASGVYVNYQYPFSSLSLALRRSRSSTPQANLPAEISERESSHDSALSKSRDDGPPTAGDPGANVVQPRNLRFDHPETKAGSQFQGAGEMRPAQPALEVPPAAGDRPMPQKDAVAPPTSVAPIDGRVSEVSADGTLVINIGSKTGLRIGDKLTIKRRAPPVRDSYTGQMQPEVDGLVGQLTVTQASEYLASGSFKGPGKPQVDDIVTSK
jgi:hypothetical protein